MERTFKEAFAGFAKDTLDTLGRNPALAEFPLAVSGLFVQINHNFKIFYSWGNRSMEKLQIKDILNTWLLGS